MSTERLNKTVSELWSLVPDCGSELFRASVAGQKEGRFFRVEFNHDCGDLVHWEDKPVFGSGPWNGSRDTARIGLESIGSPTFSYDHQSKDLVDFYPTGSGANLISVKLCDLINQYDHDSLEVIDVNIKTSDNIVPFKLVMPARLLETVDPELCDVWLGFESLGGEWIRKVKFPSAFGAVFNSSMQSHIHNYADIDILNGWLWSKELLEAAKKNGIRGLYARVPESHPTIVVCRL